MTQPFMGEVRVVSFAFAPKGWALCNGQLLAIAQNQALFAILGTMYGGDGIQTFALPNLQGRMPLHVGQSYSVGQIGGEESHTLTQSEMPLHTHQARAASTSNTGSPAGAVPAPGNAPLYASTANVELSSKALGTAGSSQPHENRPPFLVLNFVIALAGLFPSRN